MTAFSWSYWCSRIVMSTNIVKWREGYKIGDGQKTMVKRITATWAFDVWCPLMAIQTSHKFQWWQRLELLIISLSDDTLGMLCGNISHPGLMKLKIQKLRLFWHWKRIHGVSMFIRVRQIFGYSNIRIWILVFILQSSMNLSTDCPNCDSDSKTWNSWHSTFFQIHRQQKRNN